MSPSRPRLPALLIASTTLVIGGRAGAQGAAVEPSPSEASVGVEAQAAADPAVVFARARAWYDAGEYGACADALAQLAKRGPIGFEGQGGLDEKVLLYHGACLLGSGRQRQAEEIFRSAIRQSPQIRPNPLEFPAPVIEAFDRVRQTMLADVRRQEEEQAVRAKRQADKARRARERRENREQQLVELATQETVVQTNRRWVAAVPFGVGQFQNKSPTLGWLFLVTEGLALAGTAGGAAYELELHAQADDPTIDTDALNRRIAATRKLWTVSLYSLLGLAAGGILEAELSFVPEFVETRRRQLPQEILDPAAEEAHVRISPAIAATAHGIVCGVAGRF